jgi:hypothetical protein
VSLRAAILSSRKEARAMELFEHREPWPRSLPVGTPCVLSDDPADHGLSEAEVDCIEKAYDIRRRVIRAKIADADTPAVHRSGFVVLPQPTNAREWVMWPLLMLVVNLLLLSYKVIIAPFDRLAERRDRKRRKARLLEELVDLERRPFLQGLPQKTLQELWRAYGFESPRFGDADGEELVEAWIERLYGAETCRAADLRARLERIDRQRADVHRRSPDLACVYWSPPLEQALGELSRELPPYDWWARTGADVPRGRLH